jgi:small conductance mechanosensitive channel
MFTIVLAATLTEACGSDPGFLCELVFDATGNDTLAGVADFLVPFFTVLVILFAAWILNRIVKRTINRTIDGIIESKAKRFEAEQVATVADGKSKRFEALQALALRREQRQAIQVERSKQRAQTLGAVLRSLATIAIYFVAVVMALGEFNINLGPLIAGAGIVGVALGFGAQSLVKDFLSGIFMLIEDQYGVGDVVDLGDAVGKVEAVNLRTTQIRDAHGTLWHVPNGEIRRVANKSQQWARALLDVDVAYDTDLNHAMNVIKRVADGLWEDALPHATVLEEPEIFGVQAFGADAVTIRFGVKVEPSEQFAAARELRARLKYAFDEEGIEIPFPQRTVWMHQVETSDDGSTAPSKPEELEFQPTVTEEGEFEPQ